jgi:hypothetical protein
MLCLLHFNNSDFWPSVSSCVFGEESWKYLSNASWVKLIPCM